MTKKKTPQQRVNTGSKSGKAKNNHKTLADEIVLPGGFDMPVDYYDNPDKQQLYCLIIESLKPMDTLRQKTNVKGIEIIVDMWFEYQQCKSDVEKYGRVREEINGNTGEVVLRENPAWKMMITAKKQYELSIEKYGLDPKSFLKLCTDMATVKSLNHTTEEQANQNNGRMSQDQWAKKANPE